MNLNKRQIVPLLLVAATLASTVFAATVLAQVSGSAGSSIIITRTPYLSIDAVPTSFSFPETPARASAREIFSNADGALPADKLISVTDARRSGGFTLQAQASDFRSGENIIPASSLKVITTSSVNDAPGNTSGNVFYADPFTGPKTVKAPLNAPSTDFAQTATFTDAGILDGPVDLLNGCLPTTEGRIGTISVGLAFALNVPPYTVPGTYNAVITYTITDSTREDCP